MISLENVCECVCALEFCSSGVLSQNGRRIRFCVAFDVNRKRQMSFGERSQSCFFALNNF